MTGVKRQLRPSLIVAAAFCVSVLAMGFFARSPIADAVPGTPLSGISFRIPASYALIAPLSNIFDALTLLSLPQVFSAFGFVCVLAALARVAVGVSRAKRSLGPRRVRDHLRFAAVVAGGIVAVSGLALIMPRPMSAIASSDRDLVIVDFHSHTSASHDGRREFTPEENREWHRRAGFDVAYVTDHHTFAGANAALRANPALAGEGTVLLPGLEYLDEDEHLLALGLDPRTTNADPREWHPLYNSTHSGPHALLILSLPGDLDRIPADEDFGVAKLAAIELSDGSPRGVEQTAGDRNTILRIARDRGLALVSGSDNHGWGRAALAWTVLRIPGWRAMTPPALDSAIRATVLARGPEAARVVTRRLPPAGSAIAIGATGPELIWEIFRDIGWWERFAWLGWIGAGWAAVAAGARRRARKSLPHRWQLPELPELPEFVSAAATEHDARLQLTTPTVS